MISVRWIVSGLAAATATFAMPAVAQNAGAFMANPAFADPPPAQCISTFDMQHCAAHDLRVADARMSQLYGALRVRLAPAPRQRLLTEQRTWLRWRDTHCLAEGNKYKGGTLAPVEVTQCWVNVTKDRARVLARR